jgi:RNA polymerase sigma-70 factor (sigma-E family)
VGEQAADDFEEFVANRAAVLLRYAHVLTGDPHRAEDLVQSALASCYRHWSRVRPGEAERYVRKAILNAHLTWWRRLGRRRESSTADVSGVVTPATVMASADAGLEDRDEVWRALATLPPRQRAVLVLRYYDDLTEEETARQLEVTVGTVKSQHAKALRSLRAHLAATPLDEPRLLEVLDD